MPLRLPRTRSRRQRPDRAVDDRQPAAEDDTPQAPLPAVTAPPAARRRRRVRRSVHATGRGLRWVWRHIVQGLPGPSLDPASIRRRQQRITVVVVLAAVVMSVIGFGVATATMDANRIGLGVAPFIGVLAGLPLALATTRPLLGWVVSALGAFVVALLPGQSSMDWPWGVPHGLVLLALLLAVGVREPLARATGAWLVTLALFSWGVPPQTQAGWSVGVTTVVVIGLLAGRLARSNRALAQQAEVTAAEKAQRVLLEERARIARDLHDIVAHHMSLVVVQAETARYRLDALAPDAAAELESISESARAALTETRTLLSVLRQEGDATATAPQPGVDDLDDLVRRARTAGARVVLERGGPIPAMRPGTSLAAYRIVQEALANAARHAPGASVGVWVGPDAGGVRLHVVNEPPPGSAPNPDGPVPFTPGHGVTGMAERAAAEGGHVDVGPTVEGGFAVVATLPGTGEDLS